MDSDEGYNYEFDEDEECSEDSGAEEDEEEDEPDDNLDLGEVELVEPGLRVGGERDGLLGGETGGLGPGSGGGGGGLGGGPGPGGGGGPEQEEDYRYEVLTAEQILQHMVECIREVNEVIQVTRVRGFSFVPVYLTLFRVIAIISEYKLCTKNMNFSGQGFDLMKTLQK
ncbi:e3 ubiquitin-protein ligase arih1 isoform x1 [Limosa lapponica baueri]|uniref:E3 ubiquitin-protein ligase arih1 isoform x1 n=1 Tax=Limosa lapponica baueri TaxID=1758121 RepID=A0A2I0TM54_LIMLA|nr:e3 ubiquitin-protein ligase arih1 isoform x1 [Limosa lapponica baueri]